MGEFFWENQKRREKEEREKKEREKNEKFKKKETEIFLII